jgi:hypothetical protein
LQRKVRFAAEKHKEFLEKDRLFGASPASRVFPGRFADGHALMFIALSVLYSSKKQGEQQ